MDERVLFERFHEALDMEPRPSAYERLRASMKNPPAVHQRRPAFPMRWTKMRFRVAAALTAAVIAIGLVAAFFATHHAAVGVVPARSDTNLLAYQNMVTGDYNAMNASTSDNCNTIDDKLCAGAVGRVVPRLQSWLDDLDAFQTPARYAILDQQLRLHLKEAITELNDAVAFQKASDTNGFDLAMSGALYERGWIDPATFTITGTYPKQAGSYQDAVSVVNQAVQACVNSTPGPAELGCARLVGMENCAGALATSCEDDVQTSATELEVFLVALAQNPIPSSVPLPVRNTQLEGDLARADTALLAITDALLQRNAAKASAAQVEFSTAIAAAGQDASTILEAYRNASASASG